MELPSAAATMGAQMPAARVSTRFRQPWPSVLWIVRHGQSAGNVARDDAEARGLGSIAIAERDMDVRLSVLGRQQADALGRWFATLGAQSGPEMVLCSPYRRARETAELIAGASLMRPSRVRIDERLREKEFGILDRLTHMGIARKYPELSKQRAHVGKFYFRPPGGESWCDVILRLRSLLEMMTREYEGQRVLVVGHQVIVNCMRYLLEYHDEEAILAIDSQCDVPNCAVTSYVLQPAAGGVDEMLQLDLVNFVAPLLAVGTPVTTEKDASAAPGS